MSTSKQSTAHFQTLIFALLCGFDVVANKQSSKTCHFDRAKKKAQKGPA